MTISPYDSLPVGNNNKSSENTGAMEYVEIDLEQLQAMSEPVIGKDSETLSPTENAESHGEALQAPDMPSYETEESIGTQQSGAASEDAAAPEEKPSSEIAVQPAKHDTPRFAEPAGNSFSSTASGSSEPAVKNNPHIPSKAAGKTIPVDVPPQYSMLGIKNLHGRTEFILPFEEALLVPDTMPDMKSVLFAESRVTPAQPEKLSYRRDDYLAGDITVYTVYAPAPSNNISPASGPAAYSNTPVDVVKSSIAFKTDKCWDDAEGDSFRVKLSVKSISAEMINERKFMVRGQLAITITGISAQELKVFRSAGDDELITATGKITASDLIYENTDSLEISQEFTIGDELPSPVKILKEENSIFETHRQITSGKLVINATILSQLLYIGEADDGETKLSCFSSKTDFTQFIPLSVNADASLMRISFNGSALHTAVENRDKFLLLGDVITHIQAYENKEIVTVSDAYHKSHELCFDAEAKPLRSIQGAVSGEISAREVINITDADRKPAILLCGSCSLSSVEGTCEKNRVVIEGSMPVNLLALDDDGAPFIIQHAIPVRGALAMPEACESAELFVDAAVKEFWFDEINSRQLELNTGLSITVWSLGEEAFCTIDNLRFAETEEPARRSTMAIYVVGCGDTLWDIAKKYRVDMEALSSLNEIDSQAPLPEGAKLFITK